MSGQFRTLAMFIINITTNDTDSQSLNTAFSTSLRTSQSVLPDPPYGIHAVRLFLSLDLTAHSIHHYRTTPSWNWSFPKSSNLDKKAQCVNVVLNDTGASMKYKKETDKAPREHIFDLNCDITSSCSHSFRRNKLAKFREG